MSGQIIRRLGMGAMQIRQVGSQGCNWGRAVSEVKGLRWRVRVVHNERRVVMIRLLRTQRYQPQEANKKNLSY
jgi:hypothetical protein